LQEENSSLSEELEEMKNAVITTSAIIEENNQKIIEGYEEKVVSLAKELASCKQQCIEKTGECDKLKEELQLSKVEL
jgi:uncharacterized coiled-coil DUF342 family protein